MASRLSLQNELESILGSRNVYYQPPESLQMKYPCIRYNRSSGDTVFANNSPYRFYVQYTLIYIDPNPNTEEIINEIAMHFPMSRYDHHYTSGGLNHDVFTIYY